jgi:hypothetical protein
VSSVRYGLGFISQKQAFFIVTAVKTSNLTTLNFLSVSLLRQQSAEWEVISLCLDLECYLRKLTRQTHACRYANPLSRQ